MVNPYFAPLGNLLVGIGWFSVASLILVLLASLYTSQGGSDVLIALITALVGGLSVAIVILVGQALQWEAQKEENMAPFPQVLPQRSLYRR